MYERVTDSFVLSVAQAGVCAYGLCYRNWALLGCYLSLFLLFVASDEILMIVTGINVTEFFKSNIDCFYVVTGIQTTLFYKIRVIIKSFKLFLVIVTPEKCMVDFFKLVGNFTGGFLEAIDIYRYINQ